jgi:hypothetical protein
VRTCTDGSTCLCLSSDICFYIPAALLDNCYENVVSSDKSTGPFIPLSMELYELFNYDIGFWTSDILVIILLAKEVSRFL